MLQEADNLRTDALRPLRRQLLGENRFVGKPIEISGDGTAIHVTIAGKFGVSITKQVWQFEDEVNLEDCFETLCFEVVDGGVDFKHDMMKGFDDDEIEKIAEYILRLHDTYVM